MLIDQNSSCTKTCCAEKETTSYKFTSQLCHSFASVTRTKAQKRGERSNGNGEIYQDVRARAEKEGMKEKEGTRKEEK